MRGPRNVSAHRTFVAIISGPACKYLTKRIPTNYKDEYLCIVKYLLKVNDPLYNGSCYKAV